MRRSAFILLTLSAIFFASCKDKPSVENPATAPETKNDSHPTNNEAFLKSMDIDGQVITLFYNEDDQLASFRLFHLASVGTEADTTYATFTYQNGRPVECVSRYIENGQKKTDQILLTYDANGHILESFNKGKNIRIRFTNDARGRMTSYNAGKEFCETWSYDKNGNVIKKDSTAPVSTKNGAVKGDNHMSTSVKYDEQSNPFSYHSLGQLLYSIGFNEGSVFRYLSRNNPEEIIESKTYITRNPLPNYRSSGTKTTTSFSHKFNRNGFLASSSEEERIQYLTNDQPDAYQKDIIKKKPTIIYYCVKKN